MFEPFPFSLFQQSEQSRLVDFGVCLLQFLDAGGRFRQEAIAPALDLLKMANFHIVALFTLGKFREHWLRVDATHQFADILSLPYLGAMRGQAAQVPKGHEKAVRQAQGLDFLVGERRQLDAEFLQRGGLALAGALAQALLFGLARVASGIVDFALIRHIAHAITQVGRITVGVFQTLEKSVALPSSPLRLAPEDLESIIERALEESRTRGASQAEAAVSQDTGLSVGVRLGEVETLEHQRDRSMGITVYFGQRKGSASTADFSPDAVRATVAKACSIARFTAEDACAGLADAALMAQSPPNLDLAHPWNLGADRAIEIAKACEAAALEFDPRINNSEGASVSTHQGLHVYGNTHGFVGGYPTTSHSVSCVVLAGKGEDMQRDYWYSSSRDWHELDSADTIGRESARRTIARLDPRKLSTRRAPALFAPELARGLVGHFTAAIRGSSQYRQSSFLLNSVGQQIFPSGFSIAERPHIPKAMGSAPFDDEGVVTKDREIIADGVLTGYILSSYSARKLGLQTTGNAGGAHNLIVAANATGGLAAMVKRLGTGLLVTELMGQGINMVTGDYSRGAAGFWVENGEIQYPVAEITIAGNLREMFSGIAAVGDDIDTRGGIRVGSILLEEMTIAGE